MNQTNVHQQYLLQTSIFFGSVDNIPNLGKNVVFELDQSYPRYAMNYIARKKSLMFWTNIFSYILI